MSRPVILVIAAMEREVRPLIRAWKVRMIERGGRRYRLFENGKAVLVCGGIGAEGARRATEAAIQEVSPVRVISVGFAGALDGSLRVGDVLQPRTVINAADGVRTEVGAGMGVLVSSANVTDKERKIRLSKSYGANAVDMEAAAVAQGAAAQGVEFAALKAISDASDFSMPTGESSMDHFVALDGTFRSVRFACHVALRPWLWWTTITLARNSSKASHALCGALARYLDRAANDRETHSGLSVSNESLSSETLPGESLVSDLNRTKLNPIENTTCADAHTHPSTEAHTRTTGRR